jgi:hypothetical protein
VAPGTDDVLAAPSLSPTGLSDSGEIIVRRIDGCHDLLALHRLEPQRYPHLLESVARGTPHGRYDIPPGAGCALA